MAIGVSSQINKQPWFLQQQDPRVSLTLRDARYSQFTKFFEAKQKEKVETIDYNADES